jgi:transposase-like protein
LGTRDSSVSTILEQLNSLSDSEKHEIISILSRSIIENEIDADFDRDELTEKRFAHNKKCPHCTSANLVKNGTHNGPQRFLCKDCHKTFGETTNTVLHSTKKDIEEWIKFAWCMVRGFSLKRCHKEVEISTRTAFFWRQNSNGPILYPPATILFRGPPRPFRSLQAAGNFRL